MDHHVCRPPPLDISVLIIGTRYKPACSAARYSESEGLVSLRIDRDVLEHFQEGGPGWQERMNEALTRTQANSVKCDLAHIAERLFRALFGLADACAFGVAEMRSFILSSSYSENCRPMARLPIGTLLLGSLFAANMASAVLSLLAM